MNAPIISFIGGGNMATSLIGGLIADGCDPQRIWVAEPQAEKLTELQRRFGVNITHDNREATRSATVVVLAVKPQVLRDVAMALAAAVHEAQPLVVSIAAGVRTHNLLQWLGADTAVVRAMPNTPALVRSGATALFPTARVNDEHRNLAESILRAVGLTLWVEREELMDAVTALSGSGPAYFFLVMEALQTAAVRAGLPRETAGLLTLQTAFGAAKMALESEDDVALLRQRVTSPGGTTERALQVLEQGGLRTLFAEAVEAARTRSEELAALLGGND